MRELGKRDRAKWLVKGWVMHETGRSHAPNVLLTGHAVCLSAVKKEIVPINFNTRRGNPHVAWATVPSGTRVDCVAFEIEGMAGRVDRHGRNVKAYDEDFEEDPRVHYAFVVDVEELSAAEKTALAAFHAALSATSVSRPGYKGMFNQSF